MKRGYLIQARPGDFGIVFGKFSFKTIPAFRVVFGGSATVRTRPD